MFTDDCQFKYTVGDHLSKQDIYIKEDDQWPIALNATTDEINASDGTVTSSFEIEFTGANGCPALAGVKIPVTASKSGRVQGRRLHGPQPHHDGGRTTARQRPPST